MRGKFINLIGQRFGRLTVLERAENGNHKQPRWKCRCDCGQETIVFGHQLKNGNTKSCGCLSRELHSISAKKYNIEHGIRPQHITHGGSRSRLYNIWCGMKKRCDNPKSSVYKYYGDRGIRVCPEWAHDFVVFRDWAISHGYQDNLTIDRIDPNGNYEPSNCRWLSIQDQQRNRRPRKGGAQ